MFLLDDHGSEVLKSLDEYLNIIEEIIVPDWGDILDYGSKFSPVRSKIMGLFLAVQATGLGISYALERTFGLDKWMEASNTMFRNRTPLSEIPVIGGFTEIFPNPLGIAEVLWDSGKMIGEEFTFEETKDFVEEFWNESIWPNVMNITHLAVYRNRLDEADHGACEH